MRMHVVIHTGVASITRANISIYIYIVSWIVLYMNPCCANSHMFVPLRVLALCLCIHAYTHKHTYIISYRLLYMNRCCANSQMVVPLQVLTLGTSSYSHICSLVDIFHITDTLVYDSVLCEVTYVCAIASAHT